MAELKSLGRYALERVLGKGAMGVVYEASDPRLNRRVAVKTILKSSLDEDTVKEFAQRFVREAQAVARLNHPNIVQVHDFGEEGDVAYLVMEHISGRELKSRFEAGERFELGEVVRIMCELLGALDFAHKAGIVHRDIKPGNVMLDAAGRVKLTDFGVARVQGTGRTQQGSQGGTMVGTPAYMAPEQITGSTVDGRADVFSAGIILYQFLTGEQPFTGSGAWTVAKKIMQEDPLPPSSLNAAVPPPFDIVVSKALAKSPAQRYQSAHEFSLALRRAFEGKPLGEDPDETLVPVARPAKREAAVARKPFPILPAVIAVVVAAAVGGGVWFAVKPDTSLDSKRVAELIARLDEANRREDELKQSRQREAELLREVELARSREADAKKAGDPGKQKELAEQTRQRESEALDQARLVKQREADLARLQAEQKRQAELAKQREAEQARQAAEKKAAAERAAFDDAVEKAALPAAGERTAAVPAAAEKAARVKVAAVETKSASNPLDSLRNKTYFGVSSDSTRDWQLEIRFDGLQPEVSISYENCYSCFTRTATSSCRAATISQSLAVSGVCEGAASLRSATPDLEITGVFPNLSIVGGRSFANFQAVKITLIESALRESFLAAKEKEPELSTAEFLKRGVSATRR